MLHKSPETLSLKVFVQKLSSCYWGSSRERKRYYRFLGFFSRKISLNLALDILHHMVRLSQILSAEYLFFHILFFISEYFTIADNCFSEKVKVCLFNFLEYISLSSFSLALYFRDQFHSRWKQLIQKDLIFYNSLYYSVLLPP